MVECTFSDESEDVEIWSWNWCIVVLWSVRSSFDRLIDGERISNCVNFAFELCLFTFLSFSYSSINILFLNVQLIWSNWYIVYFSKSFWNASFNTYSLNPIHIISIIVCTKYLVTCFSWKDWSISIWLFYNDRSVCVFYVPIEIPLFSFISLYNKMYCSDTVLLIDVVCICESSTSLFDDWIPIM